MKVIISIISAIAVLIVCMLSADQGNLSLAVNGNNIMDLFYLTIFIFIVYFFITIKSWSPKARKEIISAIVVYCCFNVYMVSTNFGFICIKKDRSYVRTKYCWSNIRILQNAVEMYNMNSATMMTKLDISELLKSKYLSFEPKGTESNCHYAIYGDLTKDGFVYCSRHLVPDTNQEILENFTYKSFTSESDLPQELIKETKEKRNAEKTFIGGLKASLNNNWPIIKILISPILVLFFPFTLHPLR